MKITAVETLQLPEHPRFLWVLVHTDEGITGIGESTDKTDLTKAAVHHLCADLIVGQDPTRIDYLWYLMYDAAQYHGFAGAEMRAISAVDIALWDILGQYSGQPVYRLLGGKTHRAVKVYNTCVSYGSIRDREMFMTDAGELAKSLLAEGITAMKIWPLDSFAEKSFGQYISDEDLAEGLKPLQKIKDAVGSKMEIALEAHSRWNLPTSVKIAKALENYNVKWLEDPMVPTDISALADLRRKTNVPVAVSEKLFTRSQYKPVLEANAADIIMCDLSWTGGITEFKKIAAMAETYQLPVTTHNCGGPVLTMASAHACINLRNAVGTETVRAFYKTFYCDLTDDLPEIENGELKVPDKPGLGVKLKEELWQRKDLIIQTSGSSTGQNFAVLGDPWAASPGDEKAQKMSPK